MKILLLLLLPIVCKAQYHEIDTTYILDPVTVYHISPMDSVKNDTTFLQDGILPVFIEGTEFPDRMIIDPAFIDSIKVRILNNVLDSLARQYFYWRHRYEESESLLRVIIGEVYDLDLIDMDRFREYIRKFK